MRLVNSVLVDGLTRATTNSLPARVGTRRWASRAIGRRSGGKRQLRQGDESRRGRGQAQHQFVQFGLG